MKIVISFLLYSCIILCISCTNSSGKAGGKNNNFEGGVVNIKFNGQTSGYKWNFVREISYRLVLIKDTNLRNLNLSSLQMNDSLLVAFSWPTSNLFFLNTNLKVLEHWGEKGKSKKGNNDISYYKKSGDSIIIFDFEQQAIKKYDHKENIDSVNFYLPLKSRNKIFQICHVSNNKFILVNSTHSSSDFEFIILDSNKIESRIPILNILNIRDSITYPDLVYFGDFVSNPLSRYIVYYCYHTGLFVRFDKENLINPKMFLTIDKTPPPKGIKNEIAPKTFRLEVSPKIRYFMSASIDDNKLYLLNAINEHHSYILDVYNLEQEGSYEYSMYIPVSKDEKVTSIAINKDTCYVLFKNSKISKFTIVEIGD